MGCDWHDAMTFLVLLLGYHEQDGLLKAGYAWEFEGRTRYGYVSISSGKAEYSEYFHYTESVRLVETRREGDRALYIFHDTREYPREAAAGPKGTVVDTVDVILTPRDSNGHLVNRPNGNGGVYPCVDVGYRIRYSDGSFEPYFHGDTVWNRPPNGGTPHFVFRSNPDVGRTERVAEYAPGFGVASAAFHEVVAMGGNGTGTAYHTEGQVFLRRFNGAPYEGASLSVHPGRAAGAGRMPPYGRFRGGYDALGRRPRAPLR